MGNNRPSIRILLLIFALVFIATSNNCYCANNNNNRAINVQSNPIKTIEFIGTNDIKSVKFHRMGWELSDPVIELKGTDKLLLSFDYTGEHPKNYSYTITHCTSDWAKSTIIVQDYMQGFEVNEIKDYAYSSGTVYSYIHCQLELPNSDVSFNVSGNYIVSVFNSYEPEKIILQKRFAVFEPLADIRASVRQPSAGEKRNSGQQLDIKVNLGNIPVSNPMEDVNLVVCQNYPFQNCKSQKKPSFIRGNEFDYFQPEAFIFDGGNEFRIFNLKNIHYSAQGVQKVDYYAGMFQVLLNVDEVRRRNKYSYYSDLNGKFLAAKEGTERSSTEADYLWVYFSLKVPKQLDEGSSVYLYGELTNWQLSPDNKLEYSHSSAMYETTRFLKQGAYSFSYVLVNEKTGEVDVEHFEGSHFDTENNYIIFFYYKPIGARYERLVGFSRVNTRNPL